MLKEILSPPLISVHHKTSFCRWYNYWFSSDLVYFNGLFKHIPPIMVLGGYCRILYIIIGLQNRCGGRLKRRSCVSVYALQCSCTLYQNSKTFKTLPAPSCTFTAPQTSDCRFPERTTSLVIAGILQ
jgi:hypothetical protein